MLGFLFKIYLGRQIPTETLGSYSIALGVAMVFVTALTSGLPLVISRSVAGNQVSKNHHNSNKLVTSGLIISTILALFFVLCIVLVKPLFSLIFTDTDGYLILLSLIPFIVFSGVYSPIKGYLWGQEKYFEVSLVEFVEQIIKIIICFIIFLIFDINKSLPAGLSISIACALSTVLGFYFYKKSGGKFSNPKGYSKTLIKESLPLTLVRFVGSLLMPIVSIILPLRLMAGGYSNEQALSLIGICMGMTMPLLTIPSTIIGSLSMALIPQLSILNKQHNNFALNNQIKSSLLFTIISSFFILPIFIAIGEPISQFLFNNSQAGIILSKYAWVIIPTGIMQISTSILNSLGHEVYTFITYAIGGLVLFLGILLLPPVIGIESMLLSMGLNAVLVSLLNFYKIKKLTNFSASLVLKLIILCLITFGLTILCKQLFNLLIFVLPTFFSIAVCCMVIAVLYFLMLFVFNIIDYSYINMFKKRLKKE